MGRISKKWAAAYKALHPESSHNPTYWSSLLVTILWNFTKAMWKNRNEIVHGASVGEAAALTMNRLHEQVQHHYAQFEDLSHYVLPRHSHLFTQRPLDDRLKMSYDYISCWLRSVDEARSILHFQQAHLQKTSRTFFRLFRISSSSDSTTSSNDSMYSPQSSISPSESLSRASSTASLTTITSTSIDQNYSTTSTSTIFSTSITSTAFLTPFNIPTPS